MKNQKGFIQIPILVAIIAGILILGGTGYLGVKGYKSYQKDKYEKEKIAQEDKKATAEREQKLQDLIDAQNSELSKQNTEIQKIKNKPSVIINNTPATATKGNENEISDAVKEWGQRVVYIECAPFYVDYVQTGSAFLLGAGGAVGITAVTNKHVVSDEQGYGPKSCTITLPNIKSYTIYNVPGDIRMNASDNEDFASIKLPSDDILNRITSPIITQCHYAELGDKLIILGYPGIGSKTGLTVTEGIISGFDGDYYVTSAKIDHGNSGGAAILLKDNCYLGMPSAAVVGTIESLGRILKSNVIFTR